MPATKKKTQAAQVYFPVDLYLQMKALAAKENKALAAWIRDLALKELDKSQAKKQSFSDLPSFNWPGLPDDLSENIDASIYDSP